MEDLMKDSVNTTDIEDNNKNKGYEEKKKKSFTIIMVCSFFAGVILGLVMIGVIILTRKGIIPEYEDIKRMVTEALVMAAPYALIVSSLLVTIVPAILCGKYKNQLANWDEEDDLYISKLEKTISTTISIQHIFITLNIVLLAISLYSMFPNKRESGLLALVIAFILYFAAIIITPITQSKLFNLILEANPEKCASTYDIKFQKNWLKNMDEAEKQATYKSGYETYAFMNGVYIVLLVIFSVLGMVFNIGLLPVIIVGILYIIQSFTAVVKSNKNNSI